MIKIPTHIIVFTLILLFMGSSPAMALCIKSENVNLRNGPGTKYEKLWEVFKYMPFELLKTKGDWHQVRDLDGDKYWVHASLTTKKYKCAVIKKDKTNLRTGPGTKYPKVKWAPVDKYFSMKVLKTDSKWISIEDATGDKAWVYRPLAWIK